MSTEHVRLSATEKNYAHKGLLISQLSILNSLKSLKEYKKLRKEEFTLKIDLKSKIDETLNLLDMLDKNLPKIKIQEKKEFIIKKPEEIKEMHENHTLENELIQLKQKILALK